MEEVKVSRAYLNDLNEQIRQLKKRVKELEAELTAAKKTAQVPTQIDGGGF